MEAPESTGLTFFADSFPYLELGLDLPSFSTGKHLDVAGDLLHKERVPVFTSQTAYVSQPLALHGSLPTLVNGLWEGGVTLPAQFTLILAVLHKGKMICFFSPSTPEREFDSSKQKNQRTQRSRCLSNLLGETSPDSPASLCESSLSGS